MPRMNGIRAAQIPERGSIFSSDRLFTYYHVEIFVPQMMGGKPRDEEILTGWLRAQAGVDDKHELRMAMIRQLNQIDPTIELDDYATWEEVNAIAEQWADQQHTNGFDRDDNGLFIESRHLKAMIKECTNILYAGERWGKTNKGPKSFVAERVFVDDPRIYLGRHEPDGILTFIGHVNGPKGPSSNLTRIEYVEGVEIRFLLRILVDRQDQQEVVPLEKLEEIFILAESNGLGALRSQGFGKFVTSKFQRLEKLADYPGQPVVPKPQASPLPAAQEMALADDD